MKGGWALVGRLGPTCFKAQLSGETGRCNKGWVGGVPTHIEQLGHEVDRAGEAMWQRRYLPGSMMSLN